ncbi:MAG: ImmA/IrrE family metallo-endopeptidase [Blastocatellia bacterium]
MNEFELPPTRKGQHFETVARRLREFAGLRRDDARLDPFALAKLAQVLVVEFDKIDGLSAETRAHLLGQGAMDWSGGAAARFLPDGRKLVILNPGHSPLRHRATLMEEICHAMLGHKANRLAVQVTTPEGETRSRDYNQDDEEEAYGVGAAALVPFTALKRMTGQGKTAREMARHFEVSRQLIIFRLKISFLWAEYKERHPEEARAHRDGRVNAETMRDQDAV